MRCDAPRLTAKIVPSPADFEHGEKQPIASHPSKFVVLGGAWHHPMNVGC